MSLRLGFATNSLGLGGVVGGVAAGGVAVLGGVAVAGGVLGVAVEGGVVVVGGVAGVMTTAGGEGGGAEAAVVAGRFGHPTRKSARTSRGATRSKLPRRCDMLLNPPFDDLFTDL
jgi:hypothetical protein